MFALIYHSSIIHLRVINIYLVFFPAIAVQYDCIVVGVYAAAAAAAVVVVVAFAILLLLQTNHK